MSWLRNLLGRRRGKAPRHIGVLVEHDYNAEGGAEQLKIVGLRSKALRGIAPVQSLPRVLAPGKILTARVDDRSWQPIASLDPAWVLVISKATYEEDKFGFNEIAGKPLDGKVEQATTPPYLHISREACERVRAIIDGWALTESENAEEADAAKASERVVVGTCLSCGRELRIKARAVRPGLHLTCRCGAKNEIEAPAALVAE